MVYIYHSFLIHSSADGHLGCFHDIYMEFRKMVTITLYAKQKKRHRCTVQKNRLLDSVGKGEGGMF